MNYSDLDFKYNTSAFREKRKGREKKISSALNYLPGLHEIFFGVEQNETKNILIGPESDNWLPLSLTDSLCNV